jgi:hypothetical protein
MDQKASNDGTLKAKRAWERYILKAEPKLTRGCKKWTLLAYCFAMAFHGRNGIGCYASDSLIASELGMYDYRSVSPYRHEALRLGWFVWNGEKKGRAQVLDIAIPADAEMATKVATKPAETKPAEPVIPAEPKHDAWIDADKDTDEVLKVCLGCEPLLGSHSLDELRAIHAQALLGVSDA